MKYLFRSFALYAILIFGITQTAFPQRKLEMQISDSLTVIANKYTKVGRVAVAQLSIDIPAASVFIRANERLGYMPFRPDNVKRIYSAIHSILPARYASFSIICQVENKNIEDLVPNFYHPENPDKLKQFTLPPVNSPLVVNTSRPYRIENGLQNRNIALWQSHGLYYDQKQGRWGWQRGRVFQTVEDLYTQSYVLLFLVPMLENAGATVFLPRERDTQTNEVIVDNDSHDNDSRYKERNGRKGWKTGEGVGFENARKFYLSGENPFSFGTYRFAQTVADADEASTAEWMPNIPDEGKYAVYVSYKTLENSATDAHYTVFHKGGKTEFMINQKMCGGTWVFLGFFCFEKGRNNEGKVVLSNHTAQAGQVITADAVKFGGGMGNIARMPKVKDSIPLLPAQDTSMAVLPVKRQVVNYEPEISTYPRFTEGARYWLQWAGIPDSIYSRSKGQNDYTDDFVSRGFWVNYLVGGSAVAPGLQGLHVPVDLALAFHSDAGTTPNDSVIGTLGICSIQNSNGNTFFYNGISRWASRDLTDIVQTQIVNDVRSEYQPLWTRRNLWNKSYSESRVPEVPSMLLELLSHQNFADMRYGLDPRFRFTVSRAIYKGILRYLSSIYDTTYVVQPLPVTRFSCRFIDKNVLELHWLETKDKLEASATPDKYIVYTRIDDGGFDNGMEVVGNNLRLNVYPGKIYSFKVAAVNKGGESFPSEVLSAYRAPNQQGEVLIINGFTRVGGPVSFTRDSLYAGFLNDEDPGVPYICDISFVGKQFEFKRNKQWSNDDAPGFGASHANYETQVIAGNTFDYPYLHGKSIKSAGFSFISASVESIVKGDISMNQYRFVDLILGKQKQTFSGNVKKAAEFKTFPLALQDSIHSFCMNGGNLLVSGAFVASDMCDGDRPQFQDRYFIENTLRCKFRTAKASVGGGVKIVSSPFRAFRKVGFSYFDQPNMLSYYVESPDAIEPTDSNGFTICRYAENNLSAGVAYADKYKICAFGFPIETIKSEKDRNKLMESILLFFIGN